MANHLYTYVNSAESSAGITFDNLADLIQYMQEVLTAIDSFGLVFQDSLIIMRYRFRKGGITWLPSSREVE